MATSGLGIPVKLLHESLGHIITVELKTGQLYRGKLAEAEDNLNISLKEITVTQRDGRVSQLDQVYIRGSMVRFFIVPDMLQNAPMFKRVGPNAMKGRGIGTARGRATIMRANGVFSLSSSTCLLHAYNCRTSASRSWCPRCERYPSMSIYQDCLVVVHSSYSPKTVRIAVLLDFLLAHLHHPEGPYISWDLPFNGRRYPFDNADTSKIVKFRAASRQNTVKTYTRSQNKQPSSQYRTDPSIKSRAADALSGMPFLCHLHHRQGQRRYPCELRRHSDPGRHRRRWRG
ncbi:Sm-like ribonucleoprotein [Cubamyces sp. BRFM 1775]|nr:Sm-like ribonucleoprotein [Cubamyces sp. BRFM 1775]